MVKLRLTEAHKRRISIGALVVGTLMLINVFYQVGMHVVWRRWLPATLAAESPTTQPADTQPADTQPADEAKKKKENSKPPEIHAAIKKRNIFTKPPSKGHKMKLTGVIGTTALFSRSGKTLGIEEGKSAHGVKVVSIDGYVVTIEYEGKEETMKLFSDAGGGRGAPAPPREKPPPSSGPDKAEKKTDVAEKPSTPAAPAPDDGGKARAAEHESRARTRARRLRDAAIEIRSGTEITIENED